jgi:capsular exopolysaccharide synthesis family protein
MTFLTQHGAPRSLMLTSTVPNEGKSYSSVALARAFSQVGKKVLLVDADLRHSALGDYLEGAEKVDVGLSSVLAAQAPLESVIRHSALGFDFVPVGKLPPNPVELLAGRALPDMVAQALQRYDHVIVDSAPVLGIADALEASKAVEGLVYVVESNSTNVRAIRNSLARLGNVNAHIFGAIITKLDDRNAVYGYGEGYGYGYGYGNRAAE